MDLILNLIICLIIALLTADLARKKRKDPFLWFGLSLLFGIFAWIFLYFKEAEKEPTAASASDERLPVTIAIDEKELKEQEQLKELKAKEEAEEELFREQLSLKKWHYLDEKNQQQGPVHLETLENLWRQGKINLLSYVWHYGMEKWEQIQHLESLKNLLQKRKS